MREPYDLSMKQQVAHLHNQGLGPTAIRKQLLEVHTSAPSTRTIQVWIADMKNTGSLDFVPSDTAESKLEAAFDGEPLFKIGILDIETTGLTADFGYILCCVIADLEGQKFDVIRLDETEYYQKNRENPEAWLNGIDQGVLEEIVKLYDSYDIIFHYNGRNFDIKFINTRCLKVINAILPPKKQMDVYQIAKWKLRMASKKLDAVATFLQVGEHKPGHVWHYWQMAAAGIKAGMDHVVEHCMEDVIVLWKVAKRLKPFYNFIGKSG